MAINIDNDNLAVNEGYNERTRLKNWWGTVKDNFAGVRDYVNAFAAAFRTHKSTKANGSALGHVTLSDSPDSGSGVSGGKAATPKAVYTEQEARKSADSSHAAVTASGSASGHVKLSDTVSAGDGIGSGKAATPKAVYAERQARETADSSHAEVTASGSVSGHVKLSGTIDENFLHDECGTAATPSAVFALRNKLEVDISNAKTRLQKNIDDEAEAREAAVNTLNQSLENKLDKTQYAGTTQAGVIRLHKRGDGTNISGLVVYEDGTAVVNTSANKGTTRDGAGQISIVAASNEEIAQKAHEYKPIVPKTLDYAVEQSAAVKNLIDRITDIDARLVSLETSYVEVNASLSADIREGILNITTAEATGTNENVYYRLIISDISEAQRIDEEGAGGMFTVKINGTKLTDDNATEIVGSQIPGLINKLADGNAYVVYSKTKNCYVTAEA